MSKAIDGICSEILDEAKRDIEKVSEYISEGTISLAAHECIMDRMQRTFKYLCILVAIMAIAMATTVTAFVWLWSQYNYESSESTSTITYTTEAEDGGNAVINKDGEVTINGEGYNDNGDQNQDSNND